MLFILTKSYCYMSKCINRFIILKNMNTHCVKGGKSFFFFLCMTDRLSNTNICYYMCFIASYSLHNKKKSIFPRDTVSSHISREEKIPRDMYSVYIRNFRLRIKLKIYILNTWNEMFYSSVNVVVFIFCFFGCCLYLSTSICYILGVNS